MGWTKVAANGGMGLEAQWILKECNAPLCSLKEDKEGGWVGWRASLLNRSGISAVAFHVGKVPLATAQALCERELRLMGWSWGSAPSAAPTASA